MHIPTIIKSHNRRILQLFQVLLFREELFHNKRNSFILGWTFEINMETLLAVLQLCSLCILQMSQFYFQVTGTVITFVVTSIQFHFMIEQLN
jgi:hypothetical protein